MSGTDGLHPEHGSACNRVRIGGITELLGDPAVKPEKPHTIIRFPGGLVEVARTSDDEYWVHVAVREEWNATAGRIIRARIDHEGRYNSDGNAVLQAAIEARDTRHIAFLIAPGAPR